jgi:uncharacterized lipoprotein YmbA
MALLRTPAWLLAVALLLLGGCASVNHWHRYEICFGMSRKGGETEASESQWRRFTQKEISTRFPDGFTVYDARGYWRSENRIASEHTKVLMIVVPPTSESRQKLDAVIQAYKQQFQQKSVLEIRSNVEVEFK